MKKLLSTAAMLAALTTPALAAQDLKPYVGIDLQRYNIDYANGLDSAMEDSLNGINIHVGNRFTKNFGVELGYFRTREEDKTVNFDLSGVTGTPGDVLNSTEVQAQGFTLDGMGYIPLDAAEKLELIGTAGISWTKAELTLNGTVLGVAGSFSDDDSEIGFRLGAGAQYAVTEQVNLRGLVRYQTMSFEDSGFDTTNHAWVYSLGANYGF
jgi:opacity protein-like surface antigen